jgi:putative membrane protein
MPRRLCLFVLAGMLAALAPGIAAAHDYAVPGQQATWRDRRFVEAAANAGRFEVALGRIAERRAASREVRRYGAWMVKDNAAIVARLRGLAAGDGLGVPRQLDGVHHRQLGRLAALHGPAFDQAYMVAMLGDHDRAIRLFRSEVGAGNDPDIRRFAQNALAALARHDQLAQQIIRSLTATGASQPPR